jgi:hypothetical protein
LRIVPAEGAMQLKSYALMFVLAVACGPSSRGTPGDDGTTGGDGGGGSATADCATNCSNPACSGIDGCPVCGMVDQPQSTPLPLPDTNQATGRTCTSQAMCTNSAYPNCIQGGDGGECALSYVDTLNFVGFGAGQTLTDVTKLISVCATIEHSYFGDLQIELISPDGKMATMRKFAGLGKTDEFFLGHANDCDGVEPGEGSGYKYCWTQTATTQMLTADNTTCAAGSGCEVWTDPMCHEANVIRGGNYLPEQGAFAALQGAQLNGAWTFRITDLWEEDNGHLFDWSIQFDPSLVSDCSAPIIQ